MPLMKSWVSSANDAGAPFPLNNLPYGVALNDKGYPTALVTAIGDRVLNLSLLEEEGILAPKGDFPTARVLFNTWNLFMKSADWQQFRNDLIELLADGGNSALKNNADLVERAMSPLSEAHLGMPFRVSEFTDFYAGKHHATNVGTMFRGAENALPPNWLHMPIGYNGRASSVVVSGTEVRRPWGQLKEAEFDDPIFAPSRRFDIELELGAIVGKPSSGPISVDEADVNIFGYILLNDWSARDIQAWEYQPLGPFQAKATATTISPWIVTKDALEPFRRPAPQRERTLLPHLKDTGPMHYDIDLSVVMNDTVISETNATELYYSAAQQLAHHASSGCPMRTGDLLGSGTISGPNRNQTGSLLEQTWGGRDPITLANGVTRTYIEDGDTMSLRGTAKGDGYDIGFGPCSGTLLPAL